MMVELQRISSHLVWLGTHAIDLGAMSVFLYCFREREEILNIFEMFAGQRMMTSYIRIGGVALDPPAGWRQAVDKFLRMMPSRVAEIRESLKIVRQAMERILDEGPIKAEAPGIIPPQREKMKMEMEALIYHFKIFTEGFSPKPGDAFVSVESPRGELGCFVASDG